MDPGSNGNQTVRGKWAIISYIFDNVQYRKRVISYLLENGSEIYYEGIERYRSFSKLPALT